MQPAPGQMSIGTTVDYTVRVLTHGEEVSGVTLSMSFDPAFLEVVDESGNPAGVIRPHQESPMGVAPSVNQVDNATGAIRYTIAASAAVSTDFDLAIVSFKAKKTPTLVGLPTEVVFLVRGDEETAVSNSGSAMLLKTTSGYAGSLISIDERVVEIVMEPVSAASAPVVIVPGSTVDFTVKVLTPGVEITAVQLSISFDPQFIEVVDAVPLTFVSGVQIESHSTSPFHPNIPGTFTLDNIADNIEGTIRYTIGNSNPAATDFNLAIISFKAKEAATPVGSPTAVVFVVQDGLDTAVSKSGALLHKARENFAGAFISIQAQ